MQYDGIEGCIETYLYLRKASYTSKSKLAL